MSYDPPTCEKCGKERGDQYPLWIEWDGPTKGHPDFAIAVDAEDNEEKLMCPECIEEQGGSGFEYSRLHDDEDDDVPAAPEEQLRFPFARSAKP